jgi:C4-dicarboxylate transporter DctM subunit
LIFILFGFFALFLLIGVPIAFSVGMSVLIVMTMSGMPFMVLAQKILQAADSFSLLAIPLFILSGELMNRGGLTLRLVNFAHSVIGHIRGGLGQTSVLASMIFAGISGSAVADSTAIGSILIPAMNKKKYKPGFSAALNAASSCIGPIIPPSIIMILYGSITEVSIGGLFLAGVIPGVTIGLGMMLVVYLFASPAYHPDLVREARVPFRELIREFFYAVPALIMPVIIIFGIISGVFTATEAGSVAVVYAFLVGKFYYGAFEMKDIPSMFISSASTTAMVMSIIVFAYAFGWFLAWNMFPAAAAEFFSNLTQNKYVFLLIIIAFLLILGTVMEVLAIATIFGPLLNLMGQEYGFHPIYFGIMMIIIMQTGGTTPPVGILLNISCGIAQIKTAEAMRYLWAFIAVMVLVVILMMIFPSMAMFLPSIFMDLGK